MTLEDNPFFVLGLAADASRIELEREAQKLLGMLELGLRRGADLRDAARAAAADARGGARGGRGAARSVSPAASPSCGRATRRRRSASRPRPRRSATAARPGLRRALGWRP